MKGLIRLTYRKIIDADSRKPWDAFVFDATHLEFYMQAQRLDPEGKYSTFQELLDNIPQAEQLHYTVSTAAVGYIRQLNDVIPDIANAYGKLCLPFKNFRFELVQSHVEDRSAHRIAIYFYSEPLTWIDTIHNQLLIAYENKLLALEQGQETETDLITLVPYLTISHFTGNKTFTL